MKERKVPDETALAVNTLCLHLAVLSAAVARQSHDQHGPCPLFEAVLALPVNKPTTWDGLKDRLIATMQLCLVHLDAQDGRE